MGWWARPLWQSTSCRRITRKYTQEQPESTFPVTDLAHKLSLFVDLASGST
jgi:hypothetical protein